MTNEKSIQVAQGLSILSTLIASGRIDGAVFADVLSKGFVPQFLDGVSRRPGVVDEDRARILDALEMVSP